MTDIALLETFRADTPLAVEVSPTEGRTARFKFYNGISNYPCLR
jgi:hypothetical protein